MNSYKLTEIDPEGVGFHSYQMCSMFHSYAQHAKECHQSDLGYITGVAGITAIGAVATSGLDYDHETGCAAAAVSCMLEATSGAGPTVLDPCSVVRAWLPKPTCQSADGRSMLQTNPWVIVLSIEFPHDQTVTLHCEELGSLTAENMVALQLTAPNPRWRKPKTWQVQARHGLLPFHLPRQHGQFCY